MTCRVHASGKKKKKEKKRRGGPVLGRRRAVNAARGELMLAAAGWADFGPVRSGGLKLFFSFILFRI
jgi:hypothetical protein